MNKQLILICWDFPPNAGIGGRRWAKFAKGLVNLGYTLHVVKSKNQSENISPWFKDINNDHVFLYEIEPFWAVKWLHTYNTLFSSLKIRIASLFLKAFFKGTIYDKAIGVEKELIQQTQSIIAKHNIKNIIVTGAPFNLIFYAAELKSKMSSLNIIADYRDPWINSVNYGMRELNNKRMQQEIQKQNFVFNYIDTITAPNEFLLQQIEEINTSKKKIYSNFKALSHIFDPDEFIQTKLTQRNLNSFKLIYAGALYTDSDNYLEILAHNIIQFIKDNPDIKIELDIYTDHTTKIFKNLHLENIVKILKPVGNQIFNLISEYDMMIVLLSHHNKDFKTTKFVEFLPYQKPYLYVGPRGFVSKSIEEEKLGYVLDHSSLSIIYNTYKLDGFKTELSDQKNVYSLENVTKSIEKLLV